MKQLKKIASIMLALVMVLAMAIPVMAQNTQTPAGNTGSITIDNATKDSTYTIYKIFDLESYDSTKNRYSYTVASGWGDFVGKSPYDNSGFVTVTDGYVKVVDGSKAADFAKAALAYATAQGIENQGQKKASSATVEFNSLDLGYYLVDSTVGALCSLDTTNPTVTIKDKNKEPKIDKKVKVGINEDGTDKYDKVNDANIGDTVTFQATITAQEGAQNYVMHDEMSEGLTFGNVTSITLNGVKVEASVSDDEGNTVVNYNVRTSTNDNCTFEVEFSQSFCDTLKKDDKIVVTYTATVNENAIVEKDPNTNDATLKYGEGNQTLPSTTKTYVWKFDMSKIDGESGAARKPLAGAKFTLYKNYENKTLSEPVSFVSVQDPDVDADADADVYQVVTAGTAGATSEIITSDKTICFRGLDSGTYYLKETKAPDGYNTPKEPVVVQINFEDSDNDGEKDSSTILHDGEMGAIEIVNNTGVELPSTGGIGTTIFYVVGGILVVGAAIVLVAKKRTKDE